MVSSAPSQQLSLSAAKGEVRGYTLVQKFGYNSAVGTTFVSVSDDGIYQTPQSSGAIALRVRAGGNAADDAAGTGARKITLFGLDENFDLAEEDIILAGALVSSQTTTTFTRLFRARVKESGTYATVLVGSHAADIIIEDTNGNEWGKIVLDGYPHGTTEIGLYSVPAGHRALILHLDVFSDSTKTTEALFFRRGGLAETAAPYSAAVILSDFIIEGGQAVRDFSQAPITVDGPADIGFLAKVNTGTAAVEAGFELILMDLSEAV